MQSMQRNINFPQKINNMSEITHKYDNYIFDMDGIVWKGHEYITNALEFIKDLQSKENKKIFFLSNSSYSTREMIFEKLKKGNLEIKNSNQIYTSSFLLAYFINSEYKDIKNIYVIGREGLMNELKSFNINVFGGFEDDSKKLHIYDAGDMEINNDIQAVAVGMDHEINYYKLCYAMQVVNKNGLFFGTNCDKKVKIGERHVPAGYSIISSLETSTEKKAIIITKPDPRSLKLIFKNHDIDYNEMELSRTLMVGDNLRTDIKFANNANIDSLLSLTGVTSESNLKEVDFGASDIGRPTYYADEIKI